jgi:hypothetical protein
MLLLKSMTVLAVCVKSSDAAVTVLEFSPAATLSQLAAVENRHVFIYSHSVVTASMLRFCCMEIIAITYHITTKCFADHQCVQKCYVLRLI